MGACDSAPRVRTVSREATVESAFTSKNLENNRVFLQSVSRMMAGAVDEGAGARTSPGPRREHLRDHSESTAAHARAEASP